MGVPVDAPSAPKLRLVGILGIVGRTGHFLRSRDGGIARQGYRGYKGGLEGGARGKSRGAPRTTLRRVCMQHGRKSQTLIAMIRPPPIG